MTTRIESQEAGLSFDLPDITQGQLEQFFRAERGVRREALADDQALVTNVADVITTAVRAALKQNLAPTSPELAALIEHASKRGIAQVARAQADADITELEQSGAYARAAARLGWLGDVTEEQVAGWRPGVVSWVVGQIAQVIAGARELPKN